MKILPIFVIFLLIASTGFAALSDELESKLQYLTPILTDYSTYLNPVLPFILIINVTDTSEVIPINVTTSGVNIVVSNASELSCGIDSVSLQGALSADSLASVKSALPNEITCYSNSFKGEMVANAINGALGGEYLIVKDPSFIGSVVRYIVSVINWIRSFFT
ncbi:Uncharacterised protein [Candidatus Tiddalikarchaeum anstoanum]|nr:Uncharacterised protein [Candidatus Tiddalikarchaeum anstoanum]